MITFIHMYVTSSVRCKAIGVFIMAMAVLCNFDAFAQTTTLWLVRHAEKSTDNTANHDPDLSEAGVKRAEALALLLDKQPIAAIYSTNYKRTLSTVAPLATRLKLQPVIYTPKDINAVVQKVLDTNKGKAVLIVGHSNTIIPIIKALGGSVPFDELNDKDYDLLFKLMVDEKGKTQLTISHFGYPYHVTEIPAKYTELKQ
jgi:2,3-bisphosphoglycerate-dependent phosphoglycerate mutase